MSGYVFETALKVEIKTEDNRPETINMGVIRIEKNFDVVFYTGKGLREIWKPDMTDEQKEIAEQLKKKSEDYLIEHHYIGKTPFNNILKVK